VDFVWGDVSDINLTLKQTNIWRACWCISVTYGTTVICASNRFELDDRKRTPTPRTTATNIHGLALLVLMANGCVSVFVGVRLSVLYCPCYAV